ncbi:uncharacterized protein TNCT_277781 [Trichonephila clavata]|uniref:Uncharacterized protein n=1 Tax=Trichonephila clavata TaxID=2740835 RepID=A0A8X6HTW0_TRICU|nr:uncharacterized protein TNCT_277781 [Trichonephila clavata]
MPTSVATVLLYRATDTFYGVSERPASGALTRRSVHPAAPVLLTKSGPRATLHPYREASESGEAPFSSVRSLRRGRVTRASPRRSNHSLYPARLLPTSDGYPEGNFGGNQLPGGSIGLSPLYSGRTIDLHVRTASDLQPSFLGLRPARE